MTSTPLKRILLVEDEEAISVPITDALRHHGFEVLAVADGGKALAAIREYDPAVVLLDLMLPGMSGEEILSRMRAAGQRNYVLIVTAIEDQDTLDRCFQLGADDYYRKSSPLSELMSRVQARLKRVDLDSAPPEMLPLPDGRRIDLARLEVLRGDQILASMTPREGDILRYLIAHRDRVVTREDLLRDVWCYQNASLETRTVDIHIVGLRRKVEPDSNAPTLIQTVRGLGYRWYEAD